MAHHCHATGCQVSTPPEMFTCKRHWYMLPKHLRDKIWATYRVGQCDDWEPSREYCEAAIECVQYLADKDGVEPDISLYQAFMPEKLPSMISLDTETTGIDFKHGAKPYLITSCDDDDGQVTCWEWSVNPLTREPIIPDGDLYEVEELINASDTVVVQNGKFDVSALDTLTGINGWQWEKWDWGKTHDTLIAAHLIKSNEPHDLTTLAMLYLGVNIAPLEKAVEIATKEARNIARSKFPEWRIAKAGLPEMPSAKETVWKYDMWLCRAIAQELNYPNDHPWWTVVADYANADSSVTLPLFKMQEKILRHNGLWEIYLERMRCIPVAYQMQQHGVTVNQERLEEIRVKFQEDATEAEKVCLNIAESLGHDLKLPKSGNNKSLTSFIFDVLKLPVGIDQYTDGGNPSLNAESLKNYSVTLPVGSKGQLFVTSLLSKRKRDTALSYLSGYERYWVPTRIFDDDGKQLWYRLHPNLNPTGADTLRWSSSNPNSQNFSKQENEDTGESFNLRYILGPLPGREWWSLDYENIELRIPAYESGEPAMIELFEKANDPPYFGSYHLLNAGIIYPDLFWPIAEKKGEFKRLYKSTWYQWVKNGGFAIQYGCQEKKADDTFRRAGSYQAIKESMPRITELNDKYVTMANELGYVETLPDRNVCAERGYPIYCSRSAWGKVSPTVPLNYHVQSTAMWCTMKAMTRVHNYLKKMPGHHLIMQCHDELVIDFPAGGEKNLPKIKRVKELMEQSGDDIGIPLKVSAAYHPNNWSEEEHPTWLTV